MSTITEFKQASLKVLTPNRKLIEQFATMEPAPGDRPPRPSITADLRKKYFAGQFRSCLWACVRCKQTGKLYRLNGKHSSQLFQSMNGEFKPYFKVEVEDWGTVDTLEEVAELYNRYDPPKSARSTGDTNRSVAATIPELAEMSMPFVNLCVSSICLAKMGDKFHELTSQLQRAEYLRKEVKFAQWMEELVGSCPGMKESKHLWRSPVGAAMYLTFHKDAKAASEFWNKVKIGGATPKSPEQKLERFLLGASLGTTSRASAAATVGRREMLVKCLHAWNAWRTGSVTDLKYYPATDIPKVQ